MIPNALRIQKHIVRREQMDQKHGIRLVVLVWYDVISSNKKHPIMAVPFYPALDTKPRRFHSSNEMMIFC